MSIENRQLYNFIDGFDNGTSVYDIWKQAGHEGGPVEFLEFMQKGNVPTKTSELTNDSGYVVIDDNNTNNEKTWSSSKIKNEVDAVEEKLGGTVEITSSNPSKANTVMTINPSADEINVYSVEEVDAITDELADKADDMQRQINVERARINTFTALEDGSTTGDAELEDARVDYVGNTHDNVGEHIRTVTNELNEKLVQETGKLSEDKVDNKINVYTRAHVPINTSTFDFWWTYHALTLKAGVSYCITTVARNCGNTFSYALMNVINNYVESVYSVVDNKPFGEKHTIIVKPKNDSLILFKDLPFSSPYETLELKRTNQTISQGAFVSFEEWTASTVAFDLTVDALIKSDELYNVLHRKPYTVSKRGDGNFETIGEAIINTNEDDTIVIMPGVYNEQVKMWGKNRHLIGLSKESVFVVNTGKLYGSEPIQANMGSIENMTIIGGYGLTPIDRDNDSTSYAIHIEYPNSTEYELRIENCNIISNVAPAIGMGVRHNQKVIIKDCFIETKAKEMYSSVYSNYFNCGAIFCHNDASGSNLGTNGYVSIENCELKGVTTALTLQSQDNGNTLTHRFLKNTLWSTENGKTNTITLRTPPTSNHLVGSDGILDEISFGNNIEDLNA